MSIKDASKRASTESLEGKNSAPPAVPENTTRYPRVEIAIGFMKANLHRRIPLTELAEVANLSPSHLGRLFKAQTRLTPGERLNLIAALGVFRSKRLPVEGSVL